MTLGGYPGAGLEQSFSVQGEPYRGLLAGAVRNRVGYLLLAGLQRQIIPIWNRSSGPLWRAFA